MKAILLALVVVCAAASADTRSSATVRKFKRINPCADTVACAIVDHRVPLCAGGADSVQNLQWQSRIESLRKDRQEREVCRAMRSTGRDYCSLVRERNLSLLPRCESRESKN